MIYFSFRFVSFWLNEQFCSLFKRFYILLEVSSIQMRNSFIISIARSEKTKLFEHNEKPKRNKKSRHWIAIISSGEQLENRSFISICTLNNNNKCTSHQRTVNRETNRQTFPEACSKFIHSKHCELQKILKKKAKSFGRVFCSVQRFLYENICQTI